MSSDKKSLSVALTPIQTKALKDMSDVAATAAKKILGMSAAVQQGTSLAMWEIGSELRKVMSDGAEGDTEKVISFLGYTESDAKILYDYRALAGEFTKQQVADEIGKPMANGRRLSVQHLVVLTSVPDVSRRQTLMTSVRKHCWSAHELRDHIRGAGISKRRGQGAGRKANKPQTPEVGLQKAYSIARQLHNYLGETLDLDPLMSDDVSGLGSGAVEKLGQLEQELVATKKEIESQLVQISKVKPKLQASIKDAKDAEAKQAKATKAEDKKAAAKGKAATGKLATAK